MNKYEIKVLEQFTAKMVEKIETLTNADKWEAPWFENVCGCPKNINGNRYSGCNNIMLSFVCEESGYKFPIFATFKAFQDLGACVNKGEKGHNVIVYNYFAKNKENGKVIDFAEYQELSEEEKNKYLVSSFAKCYKVFNIQQTNLQDNADLFEKVKNKCGISETKQDITIPNVINNIIKNQSWICPINEGAESCYYSISKNTLNIVERSRFKHAEAFCTNLFHEMTHSELGIENFRKFDFENHAKEELIAELSAAMVGANFGMVKYLKEDSATYLKSWLKQLQETPMYLKSILKEVYKASKYIIDFLESAEINESK